MMSPQPFFATVDPTGYYSCFAVSELEAVRKQVAESGRVWTWERLRSAGWRCVAVVVSERA